MFKESETSIDLLGFSFANVRCFLQRFSKSLASFKQVRNHSIPVQAR